MSLWSSSDNLFVDGKLEIVCFDLFSDPLKPEQAPCAKYDGPSSDEFKRFLCDGNFHVNCQGKVIVSSPKQDDGGDRNYFLLEMVVKLEPYGFKNTVFLTQAANALQSLQKALTDLGGSIKNCSGSSQGNTDVDKLVGPRVLEGQIMEFLRRMNKTFVNKEGFYLKFDFKVTKFSNSSRCFDDDTLRFYDQHKHGCDPFEVVSYDIAENGSNVLTQRCVQLPEKINEEKDVDQPATCIVKQGLGLPCAFVLKDFCFIGTITETKADFRHNAPVNVFFEQSKYADIAYVDAVGATFFVLKAHDIWWWKNDEGLVPKFI